MGFLKENEFVRFSEQAHGINIINYCTEHPEKCPDTPQPTGIATDGYPSWIYHFQDYLNDKLVVDLESCPYTPDESNVTDQQCDGMEEFQSKSKLHYRVDNYSFVTRKDDIKRALYTKNSTFPMVTELMWMEYYVPCEMDKILAQTSQCKEERHFCPADMQNNNYTRHCAMFTLLTTGEAEFIARRARKARTLGAHAMLMVGYNDEYKMAGQSAGGFIVQNSWGPVMGHSLDYLLGKVSRRDEEYMCPNANMPTEWVPVDCEGEDKWKLRKPTVLSYIKEGRKPGHFHTEDMSDYKEALEVAGLNENAYYVLKDVRQFVDGTSVVTLAKTSSADPD